MQKTIFSLLSLFILAVAACDKVENPTEVTFSVTTPTQYQEYHLGDTVKVSAFIAASANINAYSVVYKVVGGGQVKYNHKIINQDTVTIQNYWVNNLTNGGNMQLDIIAEMQPNGGDARTHTIYFNCKE
ncbi:MAG: hypothetical protein U0U67_04790 [Chitinophagales bacterium]